jgi:hypothetical protein
MTDDMHENRQGGEKFHPRVPWRFESATQRDIADDLLS